MTSPDQHEQVVELDDPATGLRGYIAIHSTALGPSLGGTRFYPFPSKEDALTDVLRLSRAMTYKSAAAGLDLGGGKAVIIGDARADKSPELLAAYARYIDSVGGRYITTEDVGTTVADMDVIAQHTRFVTGTSTGSGDPSDATAWGLFSAIRSLARRLWKTDSLDGRHIAIQGVGKVGSYLAGYLTTDGAKLTVADVATQAVERIRDSLDADVVPPDEIHTVEADIYSPCALAGALNERTIPELRCEAVAGCANNQLATPADGERLAGRGILYAPDFIVNAGGVINCAHELKGYNREAAFAECWRVGDTIERVIELALSQRITTAVAANHIAEERLRS